MSKTVLWAIALMGLFVIALINIMKPIAPSAPRIQEVQTNAPAQTTKPENKESIIETAKEIIEDVKETVTETVNEQVETTTPPATIEQPQGPRLLPTKEADIQSEETQPDEQTDEASPETSDSVLKKEETQKQD